MWAVISDLLPFVGAWCGVQGVALMIATLRFRRFVLSGDN